MLADIEFLNHLHRTKAACMVNIVDTFAAARATAGGHKRSLTVEASQQLFYIWAISPELKHSFLNVTGYFKAL